ncbi:roadblock/LC7 domain-containing protein [Methanovulcanius yangii]|uniref:roadblock/LC7 domain-containing protein n=1 Tax=Methanovulcanius yangii TaxID=1789227 RepID=UPI0029C9E48E|nr:roadblock/LC7 domain-containing protein [Methanovulcanius yangii]
MSENRPLRDKIQKYVDEVMSLDAVTSCAIVSRSGHIMGRQMDEGVSAPSFAAMAATMLASSEGASSILHLSPPSYVVAEMADAILIICSAGKNALITVIINNQSDVHSVKNSLAGICGRIGEEL